MERRIETSISRTAEITCLSHAVSYSETNPYYKSNDYVSTLILPGIFKFLIRLKAFRILYKTKFAPKGMYEYVIARTKYIDEVFAETLQNGFEQVLIFGAGFDSRNIRLTDNNRVRIFELDSPITQEAKLKQLDKRGIKIPSNTSYVPIDFNKEDAEEKLLSAGFESSRRSLFIMEGLLMYLTADGAKENFHLIKKLSSKGSRIIFDYVFASVLRKEHRYYGEEGVYQMVKNAH